MFYLCVPYELNFIWLLLKWISHFRRLITNSTLTHYEVPVVVFVFMCDLLGKRPRNLDPIPVNDIIFFLLSASFRPTVGELPHSCSISTAVFCPRVKGSGNEANESFRLLGLRLIMRGTVAVLHLHRCERCWMQYTDNYVFFLPDKLTWTLLTKFGSRVDTISYSGRTDLISRTQTSYLPSFWRISSLPLDWY